MNDIETGTLITLFFFALFSASKTAFLSSNKLLFELENDKQNITSKILNFFFRHPDRYLSTVVFGNVILLVVYTLLMLNVSHDFLHPYINNSIGLISASIAIIIISLLFFGVFIPRILVLINPIFFLSVAAIPLYIFYIIFYPVTRLSFLIGKGILKLFQSDLSLKEYKISGRNDLNSLIQKTIDESDDNGELDKEMRLFQNAMEFPHIKIKDCIVPRTEIVSVDKNTSVENLINTFVKTGLSKIIVYEEDIDNIIGYIHSSELFHRPDDWTQSIYKIPFVPENMPANKLMEILLSEKKSIAIVVDEFGGTVGIITLEDLVEEIFGEIEDEHDVHSFLSKQINEDEYVFSGRAEIDRINEEFGLEIPESDEYMTIAGYILNRLQDFPKANESITIDRFIITILKITQAKIELVKLKVM